MSRDSQAPVAFMMAELIHPTATSRRLGLMQICPQARNPITYMHMKGRLSVLIAAIAFGIASSPAKAAAPQISVDFFYDKLEPQGDWLDVADYGYCWHPRDVDSEWRPYRDGRWIYTDAGWTWDSDEDFGWAVYHYGRWTQVERIGWVWVPGGEWGPAWVSWRRSPRYIGWAPLPPEAVFTPSSGFSSRVDAEYDIGPACYSFVEVRDFGAPRLQRVIVEPYLNVAIILETRNITRVTYENNQVYNHGPRYEMVAREVSQPIPRLRLERMGHVDPRSVGADQLRTRMQGDSLRVAAFPVDTRRKATPRKVAARVEGALVDHGWKNVGPPAEVEKLRSKIHKEPAPVAEGPAVRPEASPGQAPTPPGGKEQKRSEPGKAGAESKIPEPGISPQPSPSAGNGAAPRERTGATGQPQKRTEGVGQAPSSVPSPATAAPKEERPEGRVTPAPPEGRLATPTAPRSPTPGLPSPSENRSKAKPGETPQTGAPSVPGRTVAPKAPVPATEVPRQKSNKGEGATRPARPSGGEMKRSAPSPKPQVQRPPQAAKSGRPAQGAPSAAGPRQPAPKEKAKGGSKEKSKPGAPQGG